MKRKKLNKTKRNIRHYAAFLLLICILIPCTLTGCGQENQGSILLPDSPNASLDGSPAESATPQEDTLPSQESPAGPAQIYVHITGAVVTPGVYALPPDARVFQAIELAGGLTDEAYARDLNQAAPLSDGQMVYVMTQEEADRQLSEAPAQEGQGGSPEDGRVNLNTATESDLTSLPGIGAAKAKSILAWREENGGFSQIEDLMKVQGIKEGVFSKIKDSIKVE